MDEHALTFGMLLALLAWDGDHEATVLLDGVLGQVPWGPIAHGASAMSEHILRTQVPLQLREYAMLT